MDWLEDDREVAVKQNSEPASQDNVWSILIVDDEKDVHLTTKLTMKNFEFEGKSPEFTSAYSAEEARTILQSNTRFALVLLDVVMESDHAGLDLARYIRQEIDNKYSRIILRTGQPGIAPEHKVIREFDIDGYKCKTELLKSDLETTFYTSLRAYRDICLLQQHRKILEQVINSITNISQIGELQQFTSAVLEQLKLVLNIVGTSVLVDAPAGFAISKMEERLKMFSSSGAGLTVLSHQDIEALPDLEQMLFKQAISQKSNFVSGNHYVYYHYSENQNDSVFAFEAREKIDESGREMIDLFLKNVLLSYENLILNNAIRETQELAITLMGGAMESRSKETGAHVVRVGLYAKTLAQLDQQTDTFCEKIRLAAQLHDVGKVGVPDFVLKKEGKLSDTEWLEMKKHVSSGWEILQGTDNPIIKMAANLVLDHHEKYDGSGYPNAKQAEAISYEGRITAIADVFDALCSKRCYKPAWTLEDARDEVIKCAGSHFEPRLVTLFANNFPLFKAIYEQYPDQISD